jgi:transcriptional regulator with XRE-family HTH domain
MVHQPNVITIFLYPTSNILIYNQTMEANPLTLIRFRNGYNAKALAKKLNVSSQYIDRLEQGVYEAPNPKVLDWCVENSAMTEEEILEEYQQWKFLKREDTLASLNLKPSYFRSPKEFKAWREYYWDTGFQCAKALCIPHSPVANYENAEGRGTMPHRLKEVLLYLGLYLTEDQCKTIISKTGNEK